MIMDVTFSEEAYDVMIASLFQRFPSFQKIGSGAYKPGIGNMVFFDGLTGHPHKKYMTIHVAGTNGKGSVSNMLASVCAVSGLRTGLYTSPHIIDFRERMRIIDADGSLRLISKEEVWDFVSRWNGTFEHLDLSFFEITTMMAFDWFARQNVDVAVVETGLGGRLDSTNIISPEMSIITNIGLDHCDMLGHTLSEIAFEKAGIIKPGVPAVVGESDPETDGVFERKVLYTNLPEPEFGGDRVRIMSLLTFADKTEPSLWDRNMEILSSMDLQGEYQRKNLRTVLAAIDRLRAKGVLPESLENGQVVGAIASAAQRMDFHGRWEKVGDSPYIICDIGHNSHGLKYNFSQLGKMMDSGEFNSLTIVYGAMADKDIDEIMKLFPEIAEIVFVTASGKRAMKAGEIMERYVAAGRDPAKAVASEDLGSALRSLAGKARGLVYVGGSTYLVSEAIPVLRDLY